MLFIDVQGTLIDDMHRLPIKGAVEFIASLNENKTPYIVVTNNTKQASEDFLRYLRSLDFEIDSKHYLDPLMVLKDSLETKNIAVYGSSQFIEVVAKMGYILDFKHPQAVLIGIKKDFTNDEYADMINAILHGAKLFGMHETTLYAKDGKRYPGVGAILKMLKYATGCSYDVIGKPSDAFYERAKSMLEAQVKNEVNFKDITMISDDMRGDLVGIQNLGAKGVFVLSGKYKFAHEVLPSLSDCEQPSFVCADITQYNYLGASL